MGFSYLKLCTVLFIVACCIGKSVAVDTFLETQALFAFTAYCPADFIRNWTCFWCKHPDAEKLTVTAIIYNKNDDSLAYVGYTEKYSTYYRIFWRRLAVQNCASEENRFVGL
jgi:hypothetical protein